MRARTIPTRGLAEADWVIRKPNAPRRVIARRELQPNPRCICDVAAICRRVKQIQAKMPQLLEATVGTRMPYTALTQEATVRRTFAQSVSR